MFYDLVGLCQKWSPCVQMASAEDIMAMAGPSLFCLPELTYEDSQCGEALPGQSIPVTSVFLQLIDFFNWVAEIVVLSMFPALSSAPHSKMFIPRALEKPRDEIF